jgi:hypothetical protein
LTKSNKASGDIYASQIYKGLGFGFEKGKYKNVKKIKA